MTPDTSYNTKSLANKAIVVALVAAVVSVIAGFADVDHLLRAYLTGWLYWLSLTLGCFGLMLLHNLTGGKWGIATRPYIRAGAATLPLMALAFIPIALGAERIFPWANEEIASHDPIIQNKSWFLNLPGFYVRAIVYFAVWIGYWLLIRSMNARVERTGNPKTASWARLFSGHGIALFSLAVTFASVDWIMSLEPHWFSTIYGIQIVVGQGLAALAFATMMGIYLSSRSGKIAAPTTEQLHDLGKLIFGFIMLWAYMSFMQFLIIWYANLPEETVWYTKRLRFGWQFVAGALLVLHFFFPFFLLLTRRLKRNPGSLVKITALIVVMHWVDLWWITQPAFPANEHLYLPWLDLLTTVAVGGLWLATFAWNLPEGSSQAAHQKAVA